MIRYLSSLVLAAVSIVPTVVYAEAAGQIAYPQTRRVNHVDTYFGVKVRDPYRWLEADVRQDKEVADWAAAENKVTFGYLNSIPQRAAIRHRLTELWNFPQYLGAFKAGGRYYFIKNDGLQNQPVLYVMDSLDAKPRPLLDPNTWSADGTIAVGGMAFSKDGRYVAYCRAEAGSDWLVWHVLEIASGKTLPDELGWTKSGHAAWTKDGKGFFYSRLESPKKGAEFQALNFNDKLCYHRLGDSQADDAVIYYRPEHPQWQFGGSVTEDGRWLVISTMLGTDARNRVTIIDLARPEAKPLELIDNFEHEYSFVGNVGTAFYFKTDLNAPRGRLVAIDISKPEPITCKEIIPQAEPTLIHVSFVGDRFIASYLEEIKPKTRIYDRDGTFVRDVRFPGIGSVGGFGGERADKETFYTFSSFATPSIVYHYDITTGESRLFQQPKLKFNPDDYEVRQVFYHSKDGTRVPMFIVYKKGIQLDGSNPTLLYGYGGFNISTLPGFSIGRLAWLEMGGVFAQPNLRGGGEYGDAWHKAGTKLQKQNVFDDFIAAAEWLIANKYTRSDKLAILGGSNGGLLVGAVMTQRPDLFGACLPAVGVMDMLRFHKFTEGRTWVDDYGSSDNEAEFRAIAKYSPYHNIRPGVCYPATLITTADTDDRVVPSHSFKFAAALQNAQTCDKPVLIRIETRAGHGGGKPTGKRIEETADLWTFLAKNLAVKLPNSFTSTAESTQKLIRLPTKGFVWPNEPPKDCPFEQSKQFAKVYFTGAYCGQPYGDTWYPSWASDGNMYSPWTDGTTEGVTSVSIENETDWKIATTGNAVMIGDDPQDLTIKNTSPPQIASPKPFEGRYPCGSLVYNGVWYYGTYCLGPKPTTRYKGFDYNWPILGPMPGFRISTDYGKTWTSSPLSPERPLFPEPAKRWGTVKMGAPHFVDFGKNMEHSPDGKAYLVGMGAEDDDPKPRYANLSWISADQAYLARVTPRIENMNDVRKYEFFAGHDLAGNPLWTSDFARIKPLLDWNNNMGVATVTYDAPLKKYLMCVTDGWPTCATMRSYILEADLLTGPWRLVTYLKDFGQQAYFVNFPSKFISADGRTLWLCYSANFASGWNGAKPLKSNPPGSGYGMGLHEVRLLGPDEPAPKNEPNPLLSVNNVARKARVDVSSCYAGYRGEGATDGVVGGFPNDISKEWASNAEQAGAWIKLSWPQARKINRVWLFDRPSAVDQVTAGTLEFSDGSKIALKKPLPDNAAQGVEISFPARAVTWVKFTVTGVKKDTPNVGLSEFAVFESE
jgi:prolyl oligopeptidase